MFIGKKGALELSMTTIIVIVIGVVLLSLALFFVRNLFGQVNDLREVVFREADIALRDIQNTGKFSVPDIVRVKQGGRTTFQISVANDGSLGPGRKEFTVQLTPKGEFSQHVKAAVLPNKIGLQEGEAADFTAQVAAVANAPLSLDAGYEVTVTCSGCSDVYASGGVFIEVQERRGLFG